MKTVYSDSHNLHSGLLDPRGETWRETSECPARANKVIEAIRESQVGEVLGPDRFDESAYLNIHEQHYLDFLSNAWDEWDASEETGPNARPDTFVGPGMRRVTNGSIVSKLGNYSFDSTTPIVAGTWDAAKASANVALTAAKIIMDGERSAFAACRPPGHHATANFCGGYCYLNNNALAAQSFIDGGAARVAILDVDYHHGNGTQSIFYERNDVLTISLHADPLLEYPYFLGYADEPGEGRGHGFNVNFPLSFGTGWDAYGTALRDAVGHIERFSPDVLVVALGLDTFAGDPTTHFDITTDDFARIGQAIGWLGLRTLVVLEGGYSVEWIGTNTVSFLDGLESGE